MRWRVLLFSCLAFLAIACSQQQKDIGIKEMIATAAKEEIAFAGINYCVASGTVTLSGACPTEKERRRVEAQVKQLAGVKEVINYIHISPVVLTGEHLLKRAVDSALMKYPAVLATVVDSVVILQGEVRPGDIQKIMAGLRSLGARGIDNQLQQAGH